MISDRDTKTTHRFRAPDSRPRPHGQQIAMLATSFSVAVTFDAVTFWQTG